MRPFPSHVGPRSHADRRSRRSAEPSVAAGHYLERVLDRCALDAITLGSLESANVVASAHRDAAPSDGAPCDEPHDAAALAQIGADVIHGNASAGIEGVDVFAHAITIGDKRCVLVTAGSRVDRLKTVEADLSRILA